jgi:hypothetical protein
MMQTWIEERARWKKQVVRRYVYAADGLHVQGCLGAESKAFWS